MMGYPGMAPYQGDLGMQPFGSGTPSNFQMLPGAQAGPAGYGYYGIGNHDAYLESARLGQAPAPNLRDLTEGSAMRGGYGSGYVVPQSPRTVQLGHHPVHPSVHDHRMGGLQGAPPTNQPRMPTRHHHQGFPVC